MANETKSNKIVFLGTQLKAYEFKKKVDVGEYILPFQFVIPEGMPGSFKYEDKSDLI